MTKEHFNNLQCYLCESIDFQRLPGKVRDNPRLYILKCNSCGLIFLSSFSHITDEFYKLSGMHNNKEIDLESWIKETERDDNRRYIFLQPLIQNKSLLDFGSGHGGFLQKARIIAHYVHGIEPEISLHNHYAQNDIFVGGCIEEVKKKFDVITMFHVLEHLRDPREILMRLKAKLKQRGQIICEVPNADDALLKLYDNQAFAKFTYWSCHLFYFTHSSLETLAAQANLKINYINQIQRYPLSNHLYWLAKGLPGGHNLWNYLDSEDLQTAYEKQLSSIGCCDTLIASFS